MPCVHVHLRKAFIHHHLWQTAFSDTLDSRTVTRYCSNQLVVGLKVGAIARLSDQRLTHRWQACRSLESIHKLPQEAIPAGGVGAKRCGHKAYQASLHLHGHKLSEGNVRPAWSARSGVAGVIPDPWASGWKAPCYAAIH